MNQLKGIDSVLKCAGTKPGIEIWMIEVSLNVTLLFQKKELKGVRMIDSSHHILCNLQK